MSFMRVVKTRGKTEIKYIFMGVIAHCVFILASFISFREEIMKNLYRLRERLNSDKRGVTFIMFS